MNPQHQNVGNLGDILKHAALIALASLLADSGKGRVNYLDTHAYLLHGRVANANWRWDVHRLMTTDAAYRAYLELQSPFVSRGRYLCSAGIVQRRLTDAYLYLAESDLETRRSLRDQLVHYGRDRATLLAEAACWCTAPPRAQKGRVLALIDPFRLTEADWAAGLCGIDRLLESGADGLLEVFTYAKAGFRIEWPPPPGGWTGPIACMHSPPYYLAVYASGAIGRGARSVLQALGWRS